MTRLSTDPLTPHPSGEQFGNWATFTAFVRVVPYRGDNRFDYVRDFEKIANRVEEDLKNIVNGSFGARVVVQGPVLFTHQFAQKPSRLTITGFMESSETIRSLVYNRTVESDNQVKTGSASTGGNLRDGEAPTAAIDADCRLLRDILESASPQYIAGNIFRIEIDGVLYGEGGRSFPL